MRPHHFFKKGFSPLVATILLIAFSVALATTVINWKASFSDKKESICSKMDFSIEEVNGMQLCYKPDTNNIKVNFVINNKGLVDIEGMSMLIIGSNDKKTYDLGDIKIKHGSLFEVKDSLVEYDLNYYGAINKIYLTPYIEYNNVIDICPALLIDTSEIGECV